MLKDIREFSPLRNQITNLISTNPGNFFPGFFCCKSRVDVLAYILTPESTMHMDEKQTLHLREQILSLLLHQFGSTNTNDSIYKCAQEWLDKGHVTSSGIVAYYKAYYEGQESSKENYKDSKKTS
jgi:hypothetical protein|tara:strand:- start:2415 stop:2789 length:375 start_codon:yes stop_codon:yes gene_type:complete